MRLEGVDHVIFICFLQAFYRACHRYLELVLSWYALSLQYAEYCQKIQVIFKHIQYKSDFKQTVVHYSSLFRAPRRSEARATNGPLVVAAGLGCTCSLSWVFLFTSILVYSHIFLNCIWPLEKMMTVFKPPNHRSKQMSLHDRRIWNK